VVSLPSATAPRAPRRSWEAEEDAKLTDAVKRHSKDSWAVLSILVPGRTDKQCRNRWVHTLDPTNRNNKGKWTPQENAMLKKAVQKHGKDCWPAVAAMVPSRTRNQCLQRWVRTLDPAKVKKPGAWSVEEDAYLTEAVKKHGNHWIKVAAMVPSRTNNQCSERWISVLNPAVGKKLGKWLTEEDAKLTEAVKKHGKHCWVAVAAMVPGRTTQQCRYRWVHCLDPGLSSNTVE
jgi:hypothetical protein